MNKRAQNTFSIILFLTGLILPLLAILFYVYHYPAYWQSVLYFIGVTIFPFAFLNLNLNLFQKIKFHLKTAFIKSNIIKILSFIGIIITSIILRIWDWQNIPQGIWIDEILASTNALKIIDGTKAHLFGTLPLIEGNEDWVHTFNLYTYFVIGIFKIFDVSLFGIRMLSTIPAILTIIAFYFLIYINSGFKKAVIGTILLSTNAWHLIHSRFDWDVVFVVCGGVFALMSLLKSLKDKNLFWAAVGGVFLGLIQFSYISSRLIAAGILAWLLILCVTGIKNKINYLKNALKCFLVCLLSTFITALPVIAFQFNVNPDAAKSRINQVSIVDFKNKKIDLYTLENQFSLYLSAIYLEANHHTRMGVPERPLIPLSLTFFISFGAILHLLRFRLSPIHSMTWCVFSINLLNGILTRGDTAAVQRVVFSLPIIMIWATDGITSITYLLKKLLAKLKANQNFIKAASCMLIVLCLSIPATRDLYDFFFKYSVSAEHRRSMGNSRESIIAKHIKAFNTNECPVLIEKSLYLNKKTLKVLLWRWPQNRQNSNRPGSISKPAFMIADCNQLNDASSKYLECSPLIVAKSHSIKKCTENPDQLKILKTASFPWNEEEKFHILKQSSSLERN